jgi:hypothetical protein
MSLAARDDYGVVLVPSAARTSRIDAATAACAASSRPARREGPMIDRGEGQGCVARWCRDAIA